MPISNIQEIIEQQKIALIKLEKEADIILKSNFSDENELLKKEIDELNIIISTLDKKSKKLSEQNTSLKNSLYEQIYSEKLQILNSSLKRNDILFRTQITNQLNDLTKLERDLKTKINYLINQLKKNHIEPLNEIFKKLDDLSLEVAQIIKENKQDFINEENKFSKEYTQEFEKLNREEISDATILALGKKNNIEAFVGGNLINKLGILFIILGVIAISRYTLPFIPDTFKGILMFLISGVFLGFGEFLNRKKPNVFSIGITSGGVASFYVSLSISYFGLHIISMYPALLLCILITISSLVLSQRYNSQTITIFALIGGYIPLLSISESLNLTYSAMVYFIILNLFALTISFYKKWKSTMFVGYFLNVLGTIYIVEQMHLNRFKAMFIFHESLTIVYVLFAFAIYTFIPILSNYRKKQSFTKPDIIILGLNTFISACIMHIVFYLFDISRFNGIMAIGFAVIYILLSRFIETHFNNEKDTIAIFYLTALTFTILIIPFQFGKQWLSIGWLIQSCVLIIYGAATGNKKFKKSGFFIFGLCLTSFLVFDFVLGINIFFEYKYFAITLGSLIVLNALIYENNLATIRENIYKYCVVLNFYYYVFYLLTFFDNYLLSKFESHRYILFFGLVSIKFLYSFMFAYFLPNIKEIADKGIKIISIVISIFSILSLAGFTSYLHLSNNSIENLPISTTIISTLIIILLSAISIFTLRNLVVYFISKNNISIELLPFSLSSYFLFLVTQNIILQYGTNETRIVISIIYVVAALGWIIYGFMYKFVFMRRLGLAFSVLSVAKLFLSDLRDLTQGYKIISYFAFAIALLSISFVYQYFGKLIMSKGGMENDVEDDN